MSLTCSNFKCAHQHSNACRTKQELLDGMRCCDCGGSMYRSEVHTPLSNCSAGTGVLSLGPAGKPVKVDTFENLLWEKLRALDGDNSATHNNNRNNMLEADLAAKKVAYWQHNIDDLLEDDWMAGMAGMSGVAGMAGMADDFYTLPGCGDQNFDKNDAIYPLADYGDPNPTDENIVKRAAHGSTAPWPENSKGIDLDEPNNNPNMFLPPPSTLAPTGEAKPAGPSV